MKQRESNSVKAATARAARAMFRLLGLACAVAASCCAAEAPATNAPSAQVVTAYLDYQDSNYSYMNWGMPMVLRTAAFKKEPAFSRGKIIRGTWQLGGGTSNELAFAWDRGAHKLYVDLNRNLDLTDDPGGVYSSGTDGVDFYQAFPNVRLPLRAGAGSRHLLADLSFYDYGLPPNCTAALHSLWQGKVTLQGQEWQAGLLGAAAGEGVTFEGGSLLLRPWVERNKPFSLYSGTLAAFPFSRQVFVDQQAYQLQRTQAAQGDNVRMRLQFTEQHPKLGDVKLTGQFVRRLTLEGGPYLVVIDQPAATVKVPVGRYKQAKVCLRRGDVEAYLDTQLGAVAGRMTVSEKAPVVLMAGGPLTNSVSVSRRGRNLSLGYQLLGVGGAYQMVNQDRLHPPEFTVYQGDKKVASGKFEFG